MQTAPPSPAPLPGFAAVFGEQLSVIGRSLRLEAMILGAAFALLTALTLYELSRGSMKPDFPLDAAFLLATTAFVMPYAVWRDEKLFSQQHFAILPVDRRRHIAIKTLAGAVWLGGAVAWIMLWLAMIGVIAGSDLGIDRYLVSGQIGPKGEISPDQLRMVRWAPETWNWISAFTTAGVFYLLGTAFELGVRYKLRWLAVPLVFFLLLAINPLGVTQQLAETTIELLLVSPLGLDNALSGGAETLDRLVLVGGKETTAWTGLPSMENWLRATTFWLVLSGGLFWLAASRHKEA